MASLILGAPPAPPQSLAFSSRISFSHSETLAVSLPSSTVSLSLSTASSPPVPSVYCGRGDKKTERGKRFNHSFGNARPRNKNKGRGPPRVPVPTAPQKKDKFEDDTIVKVEIDESLVRMSLSEITEEKDDDESEFFVDPETQKERIRRIIEYQKSLYRSSSSSSSLSSSSASCSSFSSARRSSSLLGLMKVGNTSLRRLFDMEHTSLANHFEDFSGSSIIKPILLWGSDTDNEHETRDPWESIKQFRSINHSRIDDVQDEFASDGNLGGDSGFRDREVTIGTRRLTRKKSFRNLPRFGLGRCRGFRFRLRLRRLKIVFCRRKC
ncbi:hypothetical protein ACFX2H_009751 [Malus domestica]